MPPLAVTDSAVMGLGRAGRIAPRIGRVVPSGLHRGLAEPCRVVLTCAAPGWLWMHSRLWITRFVFVICTG